MKPLAIGLVFSLSVSWVCTAQNQGQAFVDSLLHQLPLSSNDTVKARIYNKVCLYYSESNIDSAMKYTHLGMAHMDKMHWDKGRAAMFTCFRNIYSNRGMFDSAAYFNKKALAISIRLKDSVNIAVHYNNLGALANAKADFSTAAAYYSRALQIARMTDNHYIAGKSYINLALIHQYQNDLPKARSFAKLALGSFQSAGEEGEYAHVLRLLGDISLGQNQADTAFVFFTSALNLARKQGNKKEEAGILSAMAPYFQTKGQLDKALEYTLASKKLWEAFDPDSEDAINNLAQLGMFYLKFAKSGKNDKGQLPLAIRYLSEAVDKFRSIESFAQQAQYQVELADAYALSGNYKAAYINYRQYAEKQDSLFSQESKNAIAALENKAEMDKKNKQIEAQGLAARNLQKNFFLLLAAFSAVLIAGISYYQLSRMRKARNRELVQLNQQLDVANKTKAKLFAILSHDLRSPISSLVNFLKLRQSDAHLLSPSEQEMQETKITNSAVALLDAMEGLLMWSKSQMESFECIKNGCLLMTFSHPCIKLWLTMSMFVLNSQILNISGYLRMKII